ncbi:hypothetical protein [Pseudomonas oryzihabitans]|uniref:hypothetical protein n=1 Tax=Pseudomonas oryzihabitans TaxID=47885 RepID=UPI0015E3D3E1|nr:hypothetical protein [Pseudomonas psychrotolerans]MBA1259874.1 hypothetical protein [Pseudomonas psychrotolerans]
MGCLYRPTLKDLEEAILGYELMIARLEKQLVRVDLDSASSTDALRLLEGLQIELEKDLKLRGELLDKKYEQSGE